MYNKSQISSFFFFLFFLLSLEYARHFLFFLFSTSQKSWFSIESLQKSKASARTHTQKKKSKSHRLFYMLGLYIFTFIYVQCSNVTRLHHYKKKKKNPGHFDCCASSLVNTFNPHNPFFSLF